MRSHTYRLFGVTAAALVLAAGTAGAQGKGHGKGEEHGNGKGRGHDNAQVEERDDHDGRDLRTNGGVYNGRVNNGGVYDGRDRRDGRDVYGNGRKVPPGLAKKPGQMPPGQYKKRYGTNDGASVLSDILGRRGYSVMRTEPFGDSRYVYYRTRDGRVQRAIVTPGTDRLGFSNVPTAIVREVLARLY